MSVSSTDIKAGPYTLTAAAQVLSVPFYFLDSSHLLVKIEDGSTGAVTTAILASDYSASGAGDEAGGSISTIGGAIGDKWTILRSVPLDQAVDYTYNDSFPAETHERVSDKAVMIDQQQQEQIDRCFKYPSGESEERDSEMPSAEDRASKLLGFDSSGNRVMVGYTADPVNLADITVANVTAMRLLSGSDLTSGDVVFLAGNSSALDGGGGLFYWDATSTASENGAGSGATKASGTVVKLTNTTTGRFLRNYSDAINSRWFGSAGDGATDDTSAIQAALDAAGDVSGTSSTWVGIVSVFLPRGVYCVTGLSIPSACNFYGEGYGSVIKNTATDGSNAIEFNSDAVFSYNRQPQIRDMIIEGNASSGHGIETNVRVTGAVIENLIIRSHGGSGMFLDECEGWNVRNCFLQSHSSAPAMQILGNGSGTTTMLFDGCTFDQSAKGAVLTDTNLVTFRSCIFQTNNRAANTVNDVDLELVGTRETLVDGTWFENTQTNIRIRDNAGTADRGSSVMNCHFAIIDPTPETYTGDASTVAFAWNNAADDSGDIRVFLDEARQTSGYTVTGSGSAWTVTFDVAPASGVQIAIMLNNSIEIEYGNYTTFFNNWSAGNTPRFEVGASSSNVAFLLLRGAQNWGLLDPSSRVAQLRLDGGATTINTGLYFGENDKNSDFNQSEVSNFVIKSGTTAQRPSSPVNGQLYKDNTVSKLIMYDSSNARWEDTDGGAV